MGLVKTLKSELIGESADDQYEYRCWRCGSIFEADAAELSNVRCPACGNDDTPWIARTQD